MSDNGFFGWQGLQSQGDESALTEFQLQQAMAQMRTAQIVKVIAVHGGGLNSYPTVDVQVMTNQTDGVGNKTDHGIVYGIPVARSHGGGNAIINDPAVGDTGIMSVADRDISAVKANNGGQSNPGSKRMHDLADGIYHGSTMRTGTPGQYIQFTTTGIVIQSGAGKVTINGVTIDPSGNIKTPGGVTAGDGTSDSVTLQHHNHGGPPPTPGT